MASQPEWKILFAVTKLVESMKRQGCDVVRFWGSQNDTGILGSVKVRTLNCCYSRVNCIRITFQCKNNFLVFPYKESRGETAPHEKIKGEAMYSVMTLKRRSQKRFAGAPRVRGLPLDKQRSRKEDISSLEWGLA